MNDAKLIEKLFSIGNIDITPIIGKGEVNRVYLVRSSKNIVVTRLNSESEYNRFIKEAWCLEEASKIGIPSPNVIDVGVEDKIAYMIISHIYGENGVGITDNKSMIWQIIGTYAKKLNTIPTQGFSENMVTPGVFSDTWARYLTYNIESLNSNDKLLSLGLITKSQSAQLRDKFIKLRNKKFNFGLIHGDLSLANVIVKGEVVTLIDWGVAESTIVPHMEIVDLLQNQMSDEDAFFDNFLKGYGLSRNEYISIKPEIQTLAQLQATDKLRWAIDKKPTSIPKTSQLFKKIIDL